MSQKNITKKSYLEIEIKKSEIEKKAQEIVTKIDALSREIEDAQRLTTRAESIPTGNFFTRNKRARERVGVLSEATSLQNKAIHSISDLIQKSIAYTTVSMVVAQKMIQFMSKIIAEGFKDVDGNLIRLSETGKEFATMILDEAKQFTEKQLAVEQKQREVEDKITEIDEKIESRTKAINKTLEEKVKTIIAHSDDKDEEHDIKIAEISKKSDDKDEEHDKRIAEISQKSDDKDEEHDIKIAEISQKSDDKDKEHDRIIAKLEKGISKLPKLSLVFSILALVLSALSLALTLYSMFD